MDSNPHSANQGSGSGPPWPPEDDAPTRVASLEQILSGIPSSESSQPPRGGSSGAAMLAPDQQPTVISKQPPLVEKPLAMPSVRELAHSLVGKTLDHFELTEFVGGGGMGAVFKGTDLKLGRTVAVKILSRDQHDIETQRRFKNEAQSAARLDHENIARVYYVGEAEGWPYIVFEYIEGINLRDLVLERGPLPLGEAISFTLQVSEALRHASSREVVHRDIKPSNVLITPSGKAKLVDMGLARQHQVGAPQNDLTASGVTLGTFDYISPEQARDPRSADVRSDIYSLGCTLYFMLTGRPPFPEGTVLQKLLSHSTESPPEPRQFRSDLPDELTAILDRMLAKQPDRRHQTPGELIDDLWALVESAQLAIEPPAHAARPTPAEVELTPLERHLPWLAPLALLLVIVLASDWIFPAAELTDAPQPVFTANSMTPRPSPAPAPLPPPGTGDAEPESEASGGVAPAPPAVPSTPAEGVDPLRELFPPLRSDPADAPTTPRPAGGEPPVRIAPSVDVPLDPGELDPATRPSIPPMPREPGILIPGSSLPETPPVVPPTTPETPSGPVVAPPTPRGPMSPEVAGGPPAPTDPIPSEPAPTVNGPKLVVVGDGPTASVPRFPDLAAAVAFVTRRVVGAALPEAIIELRYNGVRSSTPISFANQKITLRAGAGFTPRVAFVPNNDALGRVRRTMIAVAGGELSVQDLHLEMAIPELVTESWSLIELTRPETVRFTGCTFTIQNAAAGRIALHPDVAFFDVRPQPVSEKMMLMADGSMTSDEAPTPLELWHCAARGEANFIRVAEAVPLRLFWQNGLLVTSERLLVLGGARNATRLGGNVELQLNHLTALVGRGLVQVAASQNARYQLQIAIRCNDNIFLAPGHSPFLEQSGYEDLETLRRLVMFTGNGNFYQANFDEPMERFWRINTAGASPASREVDFDEWSRQWPDETLPQRRVVKWVAPPAESVVLHKFTRQDFQLRPERTNPARSSAEDDRDAGLDFERLPEFAAAVKPVPPSPPGSVVAPAAKTPAASGTSGTVLPTAGGSPPAAAPMPLPVTLEPPMALPALPPSKPLPMGVPLPGTRFESKPIVPDETDDFDFDAP